jgi:hypothetical protein
MVSFKVVLRAIANRYGQEITGRNVRDAARAFMIAVLIAVGISSNAIDSKQSFGSKKCSYFQQNWAAPTAHGSEVGSNLAHTSQAWLIDAFENTNGGKHAHPSLSIATTNSLTLPAIPTRRKQ